MWPSATGEALSARFPAPKGFTRVDVTPASFGAWLRELPLAPKGVEVKSYTGETIATDAAAVVAIDVGTRDLQQCADSILRLRAEYLFSQKRYDAIRFHYTSGDLSSYPKWAQGYRPVVGKRSVRFEKKAAPDHRYGAFRQYLDDLFMYAGTASLASYATKLPASATANAVRPGMFFVHGGFPGHAVVVLDVVEDGRGHRRLLLGQGYMPAQSLHVIRAGDAAWIPFDDDAKEIRVPTWPAPFPLAALRTFDE